MEMYHRSPCLTQIVMEVRTGRYLFQHEFCHLVMHDDAWETSSWETQLKHFSLQVSDIREPGTKRAAMRTRL